MIFDDIERRNKFVKQSKNFRLPKFRTVQFLVRTANSSGGVGVPIGTNLPVIVARSPTQSGISKMIFV